MAFAGIKKQFNKANQYMNEKIGGVEGTKLDEDFVEMEKRTDVTCELVEELQLKTKEYLQPNPTARAKMAAVKGISKLSGQAKASTYPQPEGVLGDCMQTYGRRLGEENSVFASSLLEMGESLKQMADIKYSLDDNVKQNFLEPLHSLQTKDLKEVMHHRKKLQGRRLDFDCKRRTKSKDEDLKQAEDKFAESLHLAQMGMHNLLENDVEQVSELANFAESLYDYHKQATEILKALVETLEEKKHEAATRPKKEFKPTTMSDLKLHLSPGDSVNHSNDHLNGTEISQETLQNPFLNSQDLLEIEQIRFEPEPKIKVKVHDTGEGTTPSRSPLPSPGGNAKSGAWDSNFSGTPKTDHGSPVHTPVRSSHGGTPAVHGPCCQALYDFDPENEGELGFKEGDMITLVSRVDENWYEGKHNGVQGFFPTTYVTVVNPLP